MTAGVNASVVAAVSGQYFGTADLGVVSDVFGLSEKLSFSPGTGANQANLLFKDTRTLAASANETLDLFGSLVDSLGATLSFAKVKVIMVHAAPGNINNVVMGAGTNPFVGPLGGTTPTITIPPGGFIMLAHGGAGWTVTDATGDGLKFANSAGTTGVTYDLILLGTS